MATPAADNLTFSMGAFAAQAKNVFPKKVPLGSSPAPQQDDNRPPKVYGSVEEMPVRVRNFKVEGLQRTKASLVLAELAVAKKAKNVGELLTALGYTTERLKGYDVFRSMKSEIVKPDTSDDAVDVVFHFRESPASKLWVGTKVGNTGGGVELNGSLNNLLGHAEKFSGSIQHTSNRSTFANASFTIPQGGSSDSYFRADVFRDKLDYRKSSSYLSDARGFAITWQFAPTVNGKSATEDFVAHNLGRKSKPSQRYHRQITSSHSLSYGLMYRNPEIVEKASPKVREAAVRSLKSTITHAYRYHWETQHDRASRRSNFDAQVKNEFSGLFGDVFNMRHELNTALEVPFSMLRWAGWNMSFQTLLGVAYGYNGDLVRLDDRFFLGGMNLRGFGMKGVGPRDGGDALGGNVAAAASVTLSFPLPNHFLSSYNVRGQFFVDAGNVAEVPSFSALSSNDAKSFVNSVRATVGLGLTIPLGIGKLELRVTQNLRSFAGDRTQFFTIGLRPNVLSF